MKGHSFDFVQATEVRRALVPAGDIRADIAFQNDINGLLARFDGTNPPLTALGWIQELVGPLPVPPGVASAGDWGPSGGAGLGLRVIRGGVGARVRRELRELRELTEGPAPVGLAVRRA